MKCGRELMAVACDALRSVFRCSALDLLRIGSELLDECRLRLIRQAFQLRPICRDNFRLLRLTEDAGNACMRILDVVDRVFVRSLLREIEIEIQLAVEGAHQEEIPRCIDADLLHQFPQRHRLPRALAQLYDLTVTIETHHLQEKHRKLLGIVPECRHRRLDTGDIAVMIRPPDVDEPAEAARVLVVMIGDIRGKIRRYTVVAEDHTILVIPVVRRAQPDRTVLLIGGAAFEQHIDDAAHCRRMERALTEPRIERHTEVCEILAKCGEFLAIGNVLELFQTLLLGQSEIAIPVTVDDALCRLYDIRTVVAILREQHLPSKEFQIACIHRHGEQMHLIARIVDIVLALHRIACRPQQRHQSRADRRTASVPDVQRSRRIRADVLHLDRRRILRRQCTVGLTRTQNPTQGICHHIFFEIEIEEARSCHLRMIEPCACEMSTKRLRDLLRRLTKDACRLHRKVRGEIAQRLIRRLLQKNGGKCAALRQLSRRRSGLHGTKQCLLNLLFDLHLDLISFALAQFVFPSYCHSDASRPHRAYRKYTLPPPRPGSCAHAGVASAWTARTARTACGSRRAVPAPGRSSAYSARRRAAADAHRPHRCAESSGQSRPQSALHRHSSHSGSLHAKNAVLSRTA